MAAATDAATVRQYDRQIRLWGLDAQQRMGKAKVLMCGVKGLAVEIAKNIVLAGVGEVVLMDDGVLVEEDLGANYFAIMEDVDQKRTRAEASVAKLQELNPLSGVTAAPGGPSSLTDVTIKAYHVVCLSGATNTERLRVDALCRKHSVSFFSADSFGLFASVFIDLGKHSYTVEIKSKADDATQQTKVEQHELVYPSLEEAGKADWTKIQLPTKRVNPVFYAVQAVQHAHDALGGRFPGEGDAEALAGAKKRLCALHSVEEGVFDEGLVSMVAAQGGGDLNAVCSMVGGLVADNILKAISCKEEPVANHFVFDGRNGSGTVNLFPAQGKCAKRPLDW
mmetsp:Transcript_61223/g.147355  ORF Transcript_61223/g.147355 Transcript_61223/m.147355 type:complete len:337 (-) Transcript_61223:381-1391(-)